MPSFLIEKLCFACDISIGNNVSTQSFIHKEVKKPAPVFEPCNSVGWLRNGRIGSPAGVHVQCTQHNTKLGTEKAQ